jgi:hypothetical protein
VFERYTIVSPADLNAAAALLSGLSGTKVGQSGQLEGIAELETHEIANERLEAPPGFEPGVEVLQISLGVG